MRVFQPSRARRTYVECTWCPRFPFSPENRYLQSYRETCTFTKTFRPCLSDENDTGRGTIETEKSNSDRRRGVVRGIRIASSNRVLRACSGTVKTIVRSYGPAFSLHLYTGPATRVRVRMTARSALWMQTIASLRVP